MNRDSNYLVRSLMEASLCAKSPEASRRAVLQQLVATCETAFCAQAFDWNGFINGTFREYFFGPDICFSKRITTLNPIWFSKHPFVINRSEFTNEAYSIADFGSTLNNRYFESEYFDIIHTQSGKRKSSAYAFTPKSSSGSPAWIFAIAADGKRPRRSLLKDLKKLKSIIPTLDNVFSNLEYWEDHWSKISSCDIFFSSCTDAAILLIRNKHIVDMTQKAKIRLGLANANQSHEVTTRSLCEQASTIASAGGGYFDWIHPGTGRNFRLSVIPHESGIILLRIIESDSIAHAYRHAMAVFGITFQQCRILKNISDGWGNRQIAESMRISPFTVKAHIRTIYSKLDIHSRTQALNKWLAIQQGPHL